MPPQCLPLHMRTLESKLRRRADWYAGRFQRSVLGTWTARSLTVEMAPSKTLETGHANNAHACHCVFLYVSRLLSWVIRRQSSLILLNSEAVRIVLVAMEEAIPMARSMWISIIVL